MVPSYPRRAALRSSWQGVAVGAAAVEEGMAITLSSPHPALRVTAPEAAVAPMVRAVKVVPAAAAAVVVAAAAS
ncbi:MAG TPA: hypothetical protein VHR45_18880 [Thermoanaerobaculia bacterium]|nr:hypothetical protein [Thermoanaerobaculia bacterium]